MVCGRRGIGPGRNAETVLCNTNKRKAYVFSVSDVVKAGQ